MRAASHANGKDLTKEIAMLKAQLEELTESMNDTGQSIVSKGEEAVEDTIRAARELIAKYGDTAKALAEDTISLKNKATDKLVEQAETRPLTTVAAIAGIAFLAGWLCRRQ
jgi:ElaB/YqjD/DUF883 family membrane-anchored ribosome-binding protein